MVAPPSMDQKKLRLCLVGCGRIANAHADGLERECGDLLEVVACVDTFLPRAQELAQRFGASCQVFASTGEALRWGAFDAVDIMVLHPVHEEVALQCFGAGKHVLLEKPMAPTLPACERILAAAEASGCVFMVAEQSQYWAPVRAMQRVIHSGAIGNVSAVRAIYKHNVNAGSLWTQVLDGETGGKPWRFDKALTGGGITVDGGAHWLRPMRMLAPGDIDSVSAVLAHPVTAMEGESLAMAAVRFSSGVVGTFEVSTLGAWYSPHHLFSVSGDLGELVMTSRGEVRLYTEAQPKGEEVAYEKGRHAQGLLLHDFARAVLFGEPPAATAADSLGELRAALAMYKSHETCRWEPVWDGTPGGPRSSL